MSGATPFDGRVYLVDTSAWARASDPRIRDDFYDAVIHRQVVTCAPVIIELLFSAQSAAELDERETDLRALRDIPITRSVTEAAIGAMRDLARRGPLHHRLPVPDLLIAAAAQEAGVGVLHHDRHYDRLAEVLDFESRWILPPPAA